MLFSKTSLCALEYFSIFCSCLLHNSMTMTSVFHTSKHSRWSKTGYFQFLQTAHSRMSWSSCSSLLTVSRVTGAWLLMARAGGCPLHPPSGSWLRLWFEKLPGPGCGHWSLQANCSTAAAQQPIMQQALYRLCSIGDFCLIVIIHLISPKYVLVE